MRGAPPAAAAVAVLVLLCFEPCFGVAARAHAGLADGAVPRALDILLESETQGRVYEEDSVSVRVRNILPPFLLLVAVVMAVRYFQMQKKPRPYEDKLEVVPAGSRNLKRDGNIAVAILTMRRYVNKEERSPSDPGRVAELVRRLHGDLDAREAEHVSFLLYNVDPEPHRHTQVREAAEQVPGLQVMTKHPSPGQSDAGGQAEPPEPSSREAWAANETLDAAEVLDEAQKKAEFVLFLEDDVVATAGALRKIFAQMRQAVDAGIDDYLMMDLYTPLSPWSSPLVRNLERFEFKCCTQAMLFRSSRLPELVAYLRANSERPLDEVISHWCRHDTDGRKVYAMLPNPFEHAGAHSTLAAKSASTSEHTSLQFDTSGPIEAELENNQRLAI